MLKKTNPFHGDTFWSPLTGRTCTEGLIFLKCMTGDIHEMTYP
jgi:hypothetical protein